MRKAARRRELAAADYARLAAFRRVLREFLRFSEEAAESVGLTTQHYQAMLILRACPQGDRVAISDLARELLIKHNSAVGLVDRLAAEGLVRRVPSTSDRRKVELKLTARGLSVLARLAGVHRRELARIGPELEHVVAEAARNDRE